MTKDDWMDLWNAKWRAMYSAPPEPPVARLSCGCPVSLGVERDAAGVEWCPRCTSTEPVDAAFVVDLRKLRRA